MKNSFILGALLMAVAVSAEYTEVMLEDSPIINMGEAGLKDDGGKSDQSTLLQDAILTLSDNGGGRILIPKGSYAFSEVALKSNIHLLIDKDAVIKTYQDKKTGNGKWAFEAGREGPVENVSIRGVGGRCTFDFTHFDNSLRVRGISLGDVTNFLISDIDFKDNYSIFSSIILTSPNETTKTGYVGPTNGTIRNCSTFNASIGYGLAQAHAAKNVLFENLYALGGVAMRLECGVRPKNPAQKNGLFDVVGRNIKCEDGYVALLLGPHSTECGMVTVDGIEAIGCEFAVKNTGGFISAKKQHEGDKPGTFTKGSCIKNVRAVYGENAQRSPLHLQYTKPEIVTSEIKGTGKGDLRGPSITAVLEQATGYKIIYENVTAEGFGDIKPIITKADSYKDKEIAALTKKVRSGGAWNVEKE